MPWYFIESKKMRKRPASEKELEKRPDIKFYSVFAPTVWLGHDKDDDVVIRITARAVVRRVEDAEPRRAWQYSVVWENRKELTIGDDGFNPLKTQYVEKEPFRERFTEHEFLYDVALKRYGVDLARRIAEEFRSMLYSDQDSQFVSKPATWLPWEKMVVISRHEGEIQFILKTLRLPDGVRIIRGDATEADVAGKIIIGNVPLALASVASKVLAIEFSGTPPRGEEYSFDDMRAAGASIVGYAVRTAERLLTVSSA
jgi:hypothetical protein